MNIGIIGLGLMGGSFALDVKERFKDFVIKIIIIKFCFNFTFFLKNYCVID